MRLPNTARPTASLFGQLLALISLSLIAAQAISMFMLFKIPPPVPDFYRLGEIVQAYQGARLDYVERRPLEVVVVRRPPGPSMEGGFSNVIRRAVAEALGVSPGRVIVASDRGPFSDRRVFRLVRDRIEREGGREDHFLVTPFEVGVQQSDGSWRVVRPQAGFGLNPWQQRVTLWFLLSALAMAPVAYLFARRLSAPIRLFAAAAERLGRDPRAEPLSLKGSAEIDVAVRAFNDMQQSLRRYVEDRTAMVAAIAHDLRTPLTRLRFRMENAPEDLRAKMAVDVDQMEEMISAALNFVRDAARPGQRTPLELSSLLESLCDEMAETGAATEIDPGEKVVIEGDPMALRRMFTNLLENAVKYGSVARTRMSRANDVAVVEISDDGPGIPDDDLERVFEPFYRREPSRSRQTGGIGLGLAVVRSIARGHGGDVILMNRPEGGLLARVTLPV